MDLLYDLNMASAAGYNVASVEWIETILVKIVGIAMFGDINAQGEGQDLDLARRTCMDLAKLKGYIVERKQVKKAVANIRLDAMDRNQLRAHLASMLDELEPGTRAEVQRMIDTERFTPR